MTTTSFAPFIEADPSDSAESLRSVLDRNGYLFFRRVVDADPIWQLRLDILRLCDDAGWLDPSAQLADGVWNGTSFFVEGDPEYMTVYRQVQALASFQDLPELPAIRDLVERLLGGSILVHQRKIGRITFPERDGRIAFTPPHQDWHFIHGTDRTFTVWLPVGNCSAELGSLAILPGSHRAGVHEHITMQGTGGAGVTVAADATWHAGDFEVGDFLLFHSHTVHMGLPNWSGRYLRLSTDNRYQLASEPIDDSSLRPHLDDLTVGAPRNS